MKGSTDMAMFGMIILGVLLSVLGFWAEVRHRRHEQREESRRRLLFVHNQPRAHSPDSGTKPHALVAELDDAPEPATHGR